MLVQVEKRGQDKDVVSKIEILSEQKDNKILVEARYSGRTGFVGFGVYHSPSARLIASVPRNINLTIRTSDGAVVVERVNGHTEIKTGDGAIRASEISGELVAETSDGSIQIDDVSGRIEARTGDGSIRLSRHAKCPSRALGRRVDRAPHPQWRDDDGGLDGGDE